MVTFLFTDIEGSTRILKQLPEDAPPAFERHDEIIRSAVSSHGGHEVGKEGDAFFVAFDNVDDALQTCATAQHLLANES
jgi:class 3 adenylate cyclase